MQKRGASKRIAYNVANVSLLENLLTDGLGGNTVIYSAISFQSDAIEDDEYTFRSVVPFFIALDQVEDFADYPETIPENEVREYIKAIIAMNYCFNIKVFIRFDGGTEMDVYLPIFGQ